MIYPFSPRPVMTIIKGFAFNAHDWRLLFFVRIKSASVAKECIPMFRSSWSLKGISVGYLLFIILFLRFQRTCSLLGTFFFAARSIGATFLQSESVLQSHISNSRTQPHLPVEEFSDLNMDEFVPYKIPVERERERSPRTNKSPSTKTVLPLMGWSFLQRSGSVASSLTRLVEVAPIRSLRQRPTLKASSSMRT
ncbi:unnamed protein product [Brassica oleracea var. botrytis]